MAHRVRRLLEGLADSMRDDEHAHGHYSRALGMLIRVAVVAMVIVAVVMAGQAPYANAACRMNADAAQTPVLATDIELAHAPQVLRQHLAGSMKMTPDGPPADMICVAERAERHARLLALDGALFIPAYLLLTVFSLCWLLAMSVHSVNVAVRPARATLRLLLGLSAVAVLITGWLDSGENRAAMLLLERASGVGALADPLSTDLAVAVGAAYRASLYKWLASGVWAATLAAAFWHQRATLIVACGGVSPWRSRVCWGLVHGFIGLAVVAALALLAGPFGALVGRDVKPAWVLPLIQAGFIGVSLCGPVVAVLDIVRTKRISALIRR